MTRGQCHHSLTSFGHAAWQRFLPDTEFFVKLWGGFVLVLVFWVFLSAKIWDSPPCCNNDKSCKKVTWSKPPLLYLCFLGLCFPCFLLTAVATQEVSLWDVQGQPGFVAKHRYLPTFRYLNNEGSCLWFLIRSAKRERLPGLGSPLGSLYQAQGNSAPDLV